MGYLAPFSSLVGVSLIWDGLFVTTCEIEVLEYGWSIGYSHRSELHQQVG